MLLKRRQKRRVPKEFLKPRPMSGPAARRVRIWRYLPPNVLAVVVTIASTWAASLLIIDDVWHAWVGPLHERETPSAEVVLITISPATVHEGRCGPMVASTLTRAGARAGLLLGLSGSLCPTTTSVDGIDAELIPPLERLPAELFRERSDGRVLGLNAPAVSPLLHTLGVPRARWLRPLSLSSTPVLSLERIAAGEIDATLLRERVALLTLAPRDAEPSPRDRAQAAAISAALQGGVQRVVPTWLLLLGVAALTGFVVLLVEKLDRRAGRLVFPASTLLLLGVGLTTALWSDWLLPVPSLLLGATAGWLSVAWPRSLAARRADRSAEQLLRKASRQLQVHSPQYLDESDFWKNLARKAAHAHPADDVLVAELPPFSWRLKFWPNGELDESVIKERRRDIRRTPYANRQGVPVASVTHDYLVMKDVPTVLVPLLSDGEVEGYLMMIGQVAADYFGDNPRVAQQLADDMAALIRRRRQVQQQEASLRHPTGSPGNMREGGAEEVLLGARTALAELRLMTTVVQSAPVGLCYADPFGDVRILGKAWLKWVPALGADLPLVAQQGTLKPGELSLRQLLGRLTQQLGKPAPLLSGIDAEGVSIDVPVPRGQDSDTKALRLNVVRLEETEVEAGGFLASLTELPSHGHGSLLPSPSSPPQHGDPLMVFSLSRLLQRTVSSLSTETGGKVKLQTPRAEAHVVAHRRELKDNFEQFLVTAGQLAGKHAGPIVSVQEHEHRILVRILDLRLGAPAAALERAILAPSVPPAGLASLGNLVRAVENSHGYVELRTDDSWGLEIALSFIKARPRIESPDAVLANLRRHNRRVNV